MKIFQKKWHQPTHWLLCIFINFIYAHLLWNMLFHHQRSVCFSVFFILLRVIAINLLIIHTLEPNSVFFFNLWTDEIMLSYAHSLWNMFFSPSKASLSLRVLYSTESDSYYLVNDSDFTAKLSVFFNSWTDESIAVNQISDFFCSTPFKSRRLSRKMSFIIKNWKFLQLTY